jgi:hypothetical protein
MTSIWVECLGGGFEQGLDLLAAEVVDCPPGLWEAPMWPVPPPAPDQKFLGQDWAPVSDPGERTTLARRWVERFSTPWSVSWHALEVLDYDLTGELGPWAPPPPFAGHPHWRDLPSLPAAWPQSDVLDYIGHCRLRVREVLAGMTEEAAAAPLPVSHRFGGQPHAWIITGLLGHTTEHASQIRQFITAAGIVPNL